MDYRPEFIDMINRTLGAAAGAFFDALERPAALALRVNPLREGVSEAAAQFAEDNVPWEKNGRYLKAGARPGLSVFHAAGAFYLQEASAMMPANVLGVTEGEKVLDLCAAPGGKSGQIAAALNGKGLLVSNEPDANRARMLYGNLERLGVSNAVVLNEYPDKLAERFEGFFDRILVDAPCSGEGMFRREPASRLEWQANSPEGCARRQREILSHAARMLRPGGKLVYSTCTYNETEDEGVVRWFLSEFPEFEAEDFELNGLGRSKGGMMKLWPHLVNGDGQFAFKAVRRGGEARETPAARANRSDPAAGMFNEFSERFAPEVIPGRPLLAGDALWAVPGGLPELKGLKTVSFGLRLGTILKNRIEPAHAFAMSGMMRETYGIDEAAARSYLRGEEISCAGSGWLAVTYKNMPLGLGKASGGTLKNHLPKGLRIK